MFAYHRFLRESNAALRNRFTFNRLRYLSRRELLRSVPIHDGNLFEAGAAQPKNTPQKNLADFLRGPRTCTSDRDRVPNRRSSDCYARSASIASGKMCRTLAMRHLFAQRAHCKRHNLRHRRGAAMPSLVPECRMGLPAKCTFCGVPAESIFGGAHEGETRRKGETTFSCLGDGKPVGKEGVQYCHVKCRKVYLIPPPLYGGEI